MGVVRGFLRPGWIALAVVVGAFAVGCFFVLAPWQLGKNTSTQHQISLLKQAIKTDPVPVAQLGTDTFAPDNEWRAVTLTGTYLPDAQSVLRLRSVDGSPSYEVLIPLRTDDHTYLVNRGYVKPTQGTALPDIPAVPEGTVTVTGRIRMAEPTAIDRGPRIENGALQVYNIDPVAIGDATRTPMEHGYLQLNGSQPGSLGEIPLPQMDSGPYLSYGLQWLAFGVMAPLGLGYFIYSEIRHRRADRAAAAKTAANTGAGDTAGPAGIDSAGVSVASAAHLDEVSASRRTGDAPTRRSSTDDSPTDDSPTDDSPADHAMQPAGTASTVTAGTEGAQAGRGSSRKRRNQLMRDRLAANSTTGLGESRFHGTIGHGAQESDRAEDARAKLADRYGH
ncbi:hypothetical protein GCM10027169_00620 [Gordonia jinhuaensis]|uniref:SURF1-like protein n=1 Tax=Gordonia jinhuaensis TaxID=1517702 RepID=A0A916SUP4_9ACTN|nr:hypothetical protein GCM10011489_03280 [Gordonia jinhuaensis]